MRYVNSRKRVHSHRGGPTGTLAAASNLSRNWADMTDAMTSEPFNPYLRDAVLTANPEQLQLMLYDGAIRFASQGREALRVADYEASCDKLIRAQNIILEMQAGLNFDVNEELCRRVSAIYNFIYRKFVDANIQRSVQAVDDALRVLKIERETWQILSDKVSRTPRPMSSDAQSERLSVDTSRAISVQT